MKKKILVVDDAYPNRYLLEQILVDFECHFATEGFSMWEILKKIMPDLIIMDIGLPGEDGLRLAEKLSRDERYREVPVIFLTAHSSKKEIMQGMQSGAHDYLVKPVDETLLLDRISRVLDEAERRQRVEKIKREGGGA